MTEQENKDKMAKLCAWVYQNETEKTYSVGITIYNTLEIEAQTKEEAEEFVRNLGAICLLEDADFNISRIEELTK